MRKIFRFCISLVGALALAVVIYVGTVHVYSKHLAEYEYRLEAWPPEAEYEKPVEVSTLEPRRVRILAIQGGALLGLADLEVLKALEEKSGKPVYELFDFFAGSSTGAMVTALLLLPDEETGKPMSAEDAVEAYEKLASQILNGPLYHKVLTGFGVFGPALTNESRIKTAHDVVGNVRFKDLLRPAMFPAYSQKTAGLKVFRNWNVDEANIYLWSLVTAVTSVPGIFPAVVLQGNDTDDYFYGDPALISNEPSELAYLYARTHLPDVDEFIVVSLGTHKDYTLTKDIGIRGGLLEWAYPALHLVYRGESNVSEGDLENHAKFNSDVDVLLSRLSPVVPGNLSSFDDSPQNVELIRQSGRDYVRAHEAKIDDLVKRLTAKGTKADTLLKSSE